MLEEITEQYRKKNAYKYGLKINSQFGEDFSLLVNEGAEQIEVQAGESRTLENYITRSKLLIVRVDEDAIFEYRESCKGMISAKSDIHVILAGRGAKVSIAGCYEMREKSELDIYHKVYHRAPDTESKIDARGVLRDASHIIYRSDILMGENLTGLSGGQDGKFLVLSKEAKVDAIPALDIATPSVQCTHSLSITHITPDDLFYSKTRGIEEAEARELFLEGFLN